MTLSSEEIRLNESTSIRLGEDDNGTYGIVTVKFGETVVTGAPVYLEDFLKIAPPRYVSLIRTLIGANVL